MRVPVSSKEQLPSVAGLQEGRSVVGSNPRVLFFPSGELSLWRCPPAERGEETRASGVLPALGCGVPAELLARAENTEIRLQILPHVKEEVETFLHYLKGTKA